MLVINKRRLCDAKIERLKEGKNAYTESAELTRLVQQKIQRENLHVLIDQTNTGCWFIPLPAQKSS